VAVVAAVRAQNACCCLVRGLRGVAVVAAVVHGGMVTTVGLAGLELEILVWSWRDLFFRDLCVDLLQKMEKLNSQNF